MLYPGNWNGQSLSLFGTIDDGNYYRAFPLISFDVPIIANSREKDSSKRIMNEKFTLKSDHYRRDQDYYLVLADMADETQIHQKYKFAIDIADL